MTAANQPMRVGVFRDLPAESIAFYDNALPPLPADDYLLRVTQRVTLPSAFVSPAPYVYEQRLRVGGPRFGLAPGDVASVYPPANSEGDFSTMLPHVVLSRRTLPWEISLGGATRGPLVAPWLAVLLLTPDEIVPPSDGAGEPSDPAPGTLTGTHVVPLAQYLSPPNASPGRVIVGPSFAPDGIREMTRENPDLSCTVVDIEAEAFSAVAPRLAELPYLAHARETTTESQELGDSDTDGWFAVVVGNRLPHGSETNLYVAHLVSLEGFDQHLPGGDELPAGTTAVRLLSLASWTFSSQESASSFAGVMASLQVDALRLPATLLASNPVTPAEQAIARAVTQGYTAAEYQTRFGERTVGWYRGPCLPHNMSHNPQPPYPTAEAAMIYDPTDDPAHDPTTGLFDLSYAVAWQTGRLLALANRAVAGSLLDWLRERRGLVQLWLERRTLGRDYLGLDLEADVAELLMPNLPRRLTTRSLAGELDRKLLGSAPGAQALLGPPRDPTGLLRHLHRLPGLLPAEGIADMLATGADPHHTLIDQLRAASPADDPEAPEGQDRADA